MRSRLLAALVALVFLVTCGDDGDPPTLTVFAAASLTDAFGAVKQSLEAADDNLTVRYSFGGSGALVTQIEQGAPADVIATADVALLDRLEDANLVLAPRTFATNKLQILVAPGNPKNIGGLRDLARSDVVYVTEDDTVPAGKYSAQALRAAGVTANPKSRELDVKAAAAKVIAGEADATIVYVTDVLAAGTKASGVVIPDGENVVARYGIAVVRGSAHRDAAADFVESLLEGDGRDELRRRGFSEAA